MGKQDQPTIFHFRCPPAIKTAIDFVAEDQMITPSAYVRRAVARSLQADGAIITASKEEPQMPLLVNLTSLGDA